MELLTASASFSKATHFHLTSKTIKFHCFTLQNLLGGQATAIKDSGQNFKIKETGCN